MFQVKLHSAPTFTETKKFNFLWKVRLEVRLVGERGAMVIAAVLVPHVQALPHHDEQAGHEGGEEGGRGGEPEVVGRPEPTDGSDEDGPDQDQSEGQGSPLVLHSRGGGQVRGVATPAILFHKEPAWASRISIQVRIRGITSGEDH